MWVIASIFLQSVDNRSRDGPGSDKAGCSPGRCVRGERESKDRRVSGLETRRSCGARRPSPGEGPGADGARGGPARRGRGGCGRLSLNCLDVYLNPYHTRLTTITRIFLPAKVTTETVCLVSSSTTHKACIFLDTFIPRYLETDFYEII